MDSLKIPDTARPAMMGLTLKQKVKMIKSHYQKQRESEMDPEELEMYNDCKFAEKVKF